jgi:hypothetical protein
MSAIDQLPSLGHPPRECYRPLGCSCRQATSVRSRFFASCASVGRSTALRC